LAFQSSLESSVVALTLSYAVSSARRSQQQQQHRAFRAIIPRAKLLAGKLNDSPSSFRLFTLGRHDPACSSWTGGCAIAGTRWVNQCLQVFDFNQARVRRRRRGSSSSSTPGVGVVVHATDVPAHPGFERDISSALPFCHAFPKNQFGDVYYDGVLADDERVVAFRYKVRFCRTFGCWFRADWVERRRHNSIMMMDLRWTWSLMCGHFD
jgi:hypothetical protein